MRRKRPLIFLLPLFIFLFASSIRYYVRVTSPFLSPLSQLPIPSNAVVYLTEPLRISPFSSAVLGAETIEPDDILSYINDEREKTGAQPLIGSDALTQAAAKRAEVILKYQNFSHTDPHEGIELPKVVEDLGYYYHYVSENIGMGGSSAKDFVFGFMHSTYHKENLLNPKLTETGVAVISGPYNEYYVNIAVQLFAIPATKEEFLGYTLEDLRYYEDLLAKIEENLAFTNTNIGEGRANQTYYLGWRDLLLKQKSLISALVSTMKKEQPFRDQEHAFIFEYNANWKSAPILGKS